MHLAEGYLSTFAAEALIPGKSNFATPARDGSGSSEDDLLQSNYRIAMDRSEHFQMMLNQFPAWADKIDYWDVSDIPYPLFHRRAARDRT